MKDYRKYIFWRDKVDNDLTPRPPLDGSTMADVAILGAGLRELWTTYHLVRREPSQQVVFVEAEIAGFGATGRNGGRCYSGFPLPLGGLVETYGPDTAKAIQLALYDSVDDVGRVSEQEGTNAHYRKSGALNLARSRFQLGARQERMKIIRDLGLEHEYELLDAEETAEHVVVAKRLGWISDKHSATVQPARLASGLARAIERKGATTYEQTRATGFVPGPLPHLDTERANISTKAVVIAGEAYLADRSGRLLADQITERVTDLTKRPMPTHKSPNREPELPRWLGVRHVSRGIRKVTEEAERTGTVPNDRH